MDTHTCQNVKYLTKINDDDNSEYNFTMLEFLSYLPGGGVISGMGIQLQHYSTVPFIMFTLCVFCNFKSFDKKSYVTYLIIMNQIIKVKCRKSHEEIRKNTIKYMKFNMIFSTCLQVKISFEHAEK